MHTCLMPVQIAGQYKKKDIERILIYDVIKIHCEVEKKLKIIFVNIMLSYIFFFHNLTVRL